MRTTPRIFLLVLTVLAVCSTSLAQVQFTILGADGSRYPNMHVMFQADNRSGALIRSFLPTDFSVLEDGVPRPVISVSCPEPETPPMSLTFTIDISYSMSLAGRLDYAKNATASLVRSLKIPPGSVGITTFGDNSGIHLPYSQDTTQIHSSIQSILPTGNGTDFYGAFLDPGTGALDFTKAGPGPRYIVFITDALQQLSTASENLVINTAKAAGITIFTVTMTKNAYNLSLRRIATQTGGAWFENATSEQIIQSIFQEIRDRIIIYPPCELVYATNGCEPRRNATVTLTKNNASATRTVSFLIPEQVIHALRVLPLSVHFGTVPAGGSSEYTVTYTASVRPVQVTRILAPNPPFTIVDPGGSVPFTVVPGSPRTMRLRCAPLVGGNAVSEILFETDAPCAPPLPVSNGLYDETPLRLIQPNGGERLFTNTVYSLQWTSPRADLPVALEYSTDAGGRWNNITTYVTGNSRTWLVPATPSDSCLAIVSTIENRNQLADSSPLPLQPADVTRIGTSPDGAIAALAEADGRVVLASARTGQFLALLSGHSGSTSTAAFSPYGGMLATGGSDGMVRIWNPRSGELLRTLSGFTGGIQSLCFSSDERGLAAADVNGVLLWNTSDWSRGWTASGTSGLGSVLVCDPKNRWVVVSNGSAFSALRMTDGSLDKRFTTHTAQIRALAMSADGRTLVSGGDDRILRVWQIPSWTNTGSLSGHNAAIVSLSVSSLALRIVSASLDNTIKIWDGRRNSLSSTIRGAVSSYTAAAYAGPHAQIISASGDRGLRLYHYQMPQGDDSDSLWSIITPVTTLSSIPPEFDTLSCLGDVSERDVLIWNSGNQSVRVDSLSIRGGSSSEFTILGTTPPLPRTLLPGDSLHVGVRFLPTWPALHESDLRVYLSGGAQPTYDIPLRGRLWRGSASLAPATVDKGILFPCQDSLTAMYVITNDGEIPIRATAMDIQPVSNAGLRLQRDGWLQPGERDTLWVSITNLSLGNVSRAIQMIYGPCSMKLVAQLQAVVQSPTPLAFPTDVDFGLTPVGDSLTRGMAIRNPTSVPMLLRALAINPSEFRATVSDTLPILLAPGDSLHIDVTFAPHRATSFTGMVWVWTDLPCVDSVSISLRGTAEIKPSISVNDVGFGVLRCPDDVIADSLVWIKNTGGLPLHITNLRLTGADSASFQFHPLPSLPKSILPGDSISVPLRFAGTRPGVHLATLEITSDAANLPIAFAVVQGIRERAAFSISPRIIVDTIPVCGFPYQMFIEISNNGTLDLPLQVQVPSALTLNPADAGFLLQAGQMRRISIVLNQRSDTLIQGAIVVRNHECRLADSSVVALLVATRMPRWIPSALSFPTTVLGVTREDSLSFLNTTPFPIVISDIRLLDGTAGFILDSLPSLPWTIAPGGLVYLPVSYSPKSGTLHRDSVIILNSLPCTDRTAIGLSGSASTPTALVGLPSITAAVGDSITLPLTLLLAPAIADAGASRFQATISFNRSLLWPLRVSSPAGTVAMTRSVSGDRMILTLDASGPVITGPTVLAELRMLVLLGNDSTTTLTIPSFQWLDGEPIGTSTQNGSLTITGICTEGGARLMTMTEVMRNARVSDDPAGQAILAEFELSTDANVRVRLFTVLGSEVAQPLARSLAAGRQRVVLPVSGLSSGMYFVMISTEWGSQILPVQHLRR